MKVYESRVRKCKDINIIIDKKMRERKIIYEKYMIPLSEKHPFETDEFVKVVSKNDFDKLGDMIKSLMNERNLLQQQITQLQSALGIQKKLLAKIQPKKEKKSIKDLIRL